MKFIVHRTSLMCGDGCPIENAQSVVAQHANGSKRQYWTIDIDSLEALIALADKEDDLVVSSKFFLGESVPADLAGLPHIEIYDTYRE